MASTRRLPSLVAAISLVLTTVGAANAAPAKRDPRSYHNDPRSGAALNIERAKQVGPNAPEGSDPSRRILQQGVNNAQADVSAQDTQSETTLAVSGSNVVVGFNDSGSFTGGHNQFTGYSVSTNDGLSFTDKGRLPASGEGDGGDPILAAGPGSTMYLATLGFNTGNRVQVFKSTNRGASFGAPVNASPGYDGTFNFQDKEWITVDNNAGTGNGNAYVCWTRFGGAIDIRFTRSTDGGASFGPNLGLLLSNGGQGCNIVVGPDHAVYVFYFRGTIFGGSAGDTKLFVRKSTNRGASFGPEVQVADLLTSNSSGDLFLDGGFRTNGFPTAAVGPNGNLYVIYNDDPTGGDKADIFVVRSTNGGATWSSPQQIDDDASNHDQWQPAIAVAPDGATLMVSYYSRENDPSNSAFHRRARLGFFYGSFPVFHPSFQLGPDTPVVIGQDPVINPIYMGDYDQVVATPNAFHTSWADNRAGNSFHAYQPDVRYARIGASPQTTNLGIAISEGADPVTVGNNLTYRLAVTNTGPAPAGDVFVTDLLPVGVGVRAASVAGGSCSSYGRLVGCYLGVVNPGTTRTVDLVTVAQASGALTNTAQVTSSTLDAFPGDDSASAQTTVNPGGIWALYSSGDLAVPIPQNGAPATISIPVPHEGVVVDSRVRVRLNHTFDSDLLITLVSPTGRTVDLSSNNGFDGDNFGTGPNNCSGTPTIFDDSAAVPITSAFPPFSGHFRPEQPLSSIVGEATDGEWKIQIRDVFPFDTGSVGCVRLLLKRV